MLALFEDWRKLLMSRRHPASLFVVKDGPQVVHVRSWCCLKDVSELGGESLDTKPL